MVLELSTVSCLEVIITKIKETPLLASLFRLSVYLLDVLIVFTDNCYFSVLKNSREVIEEMS